VYDVAQVSPIFFRHAVEITKLVEYASNSPEKAIENTAKREVKNAMAQFRSFLDKVMQTNGNGVLGTIGSIATTGLPSGVAAQFTMAKPPGAQLFYYNQTVQVYDPTLTTNRGSANVLLVDPFNSLLQVDSLPTGTSVNDVVVHDGLTGAQPTSLFGILYHQTNATTGTWLNLNRATYPVELATPAVNGNNSANYAGRGPPGDQQSAEIVGLEPGVQADCLHRAGAGAPVGAVGRNDFADHQGRGWRTGERSRLAVYGRKNDGRRADQIVDQCESDARGFPGSVALGTRGDAGHRFLRCRRANCVSDLRHQWRIVGGVYLLFRHRVSGVE
jgi:hypothetical protein